jgi:glycerophosphoryl diester phosphodiesterase
MVELVAHRAGNDRATMQRFRAVADSIELDIHLYRGQLVVRHAKRIWLSRRLWERWYLVPPGSPVPRLEEALDWLGQDASLWVDCKGPFALRLPAEVRALVGERPLTFSGKAWWVLARAGGRPGTRVIRSAGNRLELFLLRRLPSSVPLDGVAVHSRLLDRELVAALRRRHGRVFCWSVYDEAVARRLVSWGVDGLILDDPALMQALAGPVVQSDQPGGEQGRHGQTEQGQHRSQDAVDDVVVAGEHDPDRHQERADDREGLQ